MSGVEFLERVGWVVLHAGWIGALAAAALHVALTALGRASASMRHGVACAALGAVVVAVTVVAIATFMPSLGASITGGSPEPASAAPTPFGSTTTVGAVIEPGDRARSEGAQMIASTLVVVRWALDAAAPWLAVVWLVVTGFALARLGIVLWRMARLSASLRSLPASEALGRGLALRVGVPRGVKVVESTVVAVPMVLGLVRPIVVIPAGLRGSLSSEQLELIVLHELEHVRRGDPWVALAQVVVEAFFALHPGVRWVSRQIRLEREVRCDAGVVRVAGDHRAYGRALLHLADFASSVRPTALLAATGGDLVVRIRRLSGRRIAVTPRAVALSLAGLVVACSVGVAFAEMPPGAVVERTESHPYLVMPELRRELASDEYGRYFVISSSGNRGSTGAGAVFVRIEARVYPDTRQARFVLSHENLAEHLSSRSVGDARLTLRLGDSVISVTDLTDIVDSSVIPSTIAGTPLRESRFMEDLSDDPGRTTRVCARFELTYAPEGTYGFELQACDQPLIVRPSDAPIQNLSEFRPNRVSFSLRQLLESQDRNISARPINVRPRPHAVWSVPRDRSVGRRPA